jgi:hypothetical protein
MILAICRTENPPELVEQSRSGFALQKGHTKEIGLTGRMSGSSSFFVAMPKFYSGRRSIA